MQLGSLMLLMCSMAVILDVFLAEARFFCFRRLKKKNKCGGALRTDKYFSVESCCSKRGQGFSDKKIRVGKNRFRCIPCPGATTRGGNTATSTSTTSTAAAPVTDFWPAPVKQDHTEFPEHVQKDDNRQPVVWEEWSPCSVSCGAGWRSRAKVCDKCDRNDYDNVQSQPCMVNFHCPVDGNWGPWYPWEACTSTCDGGTRTRHRKCNYPPPANGGENCPGDAVAVQECNKKPCPVDGHWSDWSDFSECSSSCGPGISKRTRRCDSPLPQFGGKNCPGSELFTKKCEVTKCPVDGAWSLWGTWSLCTATCGKGLRERTRACDSPRPQFGGSECEGSAIQQEECYGGQHCPVDGNWSPWTSTGFCRAPRCGRGQQTRTRSCTNPASAYGGKPCIGQHTERVTCYNDHDCPKNGSWCEWKEWSACSSTCADEHSIRGRQRVCSCPAASNGGLDCQGDSFQVEDCGNLPTCNIPKETSQSTESASIYKLEPSSSTDKPASGHSSSSHSAAEGIPT
ncbi:hypothetical protein BsWGS_11689 [Bradybaena similaris]